MLQMINQDIAHVMRIHRHIPHSGFLQMIQCAIDQAAAGHLHHRFGAMIGIGTQALAVSGGQYKGFFRHHKVLFNPGYFNDSATGFIVHGLEADVQMPGRDMASQTLRPLNNYNSLTQGVFPAQSLDFLRGFQTVEIKMP